MTDTKQTQAGRSMIEMLGVLAIIGVLSVGGIAGYSKAMMKFKINKTVDEIMQITTNIRTLFGGQRNYSSLSNTVLTGAKLIPDEMVVTTGTGQNQTTTFTSAWGTTVTVAKSNKVTASTTSDDKAFLITIANVPTEACVELSVIDWGASAGSGLVAMGTADAVTTSQTTSCTTGNGLSCPNGMMDPAQAINGCSDASGLKTMYWKFY
ncbi:MAG: hypothetical protein IJ099_03600 [Alphaproteobacteria bacterium]|nr:hypothetical protein [Alphaproteobacteria bacterium]